MEKKTTISDKKEKEIEPKELTTCESTAQMITKARIDGVSLSFDRAADMKACPSVRIQPVVSIAPWGLAG